MSNLNTESIAAVNEIISYCNSVNLNEKPSAQTSQAFITSLKYTAAHYVTRPTWSTDKAVARAAGALIDHLLPEEDQKIKMTQAQFDKLAQMIGDLMTPDFLKHLNLIQSSEDMT